MSEKLNIQSITTWVRFFVVVGLIQIAMLGLAGFISINFSNYDQNMLAFLSLTRKEEARFLLVLSQILAFLLTKHVFQYFYPKLASSVSSHLPNEMNHREMWLSWTLCFWSAVLLYVGLLLSYLQIVPALDAVDFILGSPGLVATFLSLGVTTYLRLKYLAKRQGN